MKWTPYTIQELESLIAKDLLDCTEEERTFFASTRLQLAKWAQSPWGDEGGGFWAVAVSGKHVLWYNDIEEGFNVSEFLSAGEIPGSGYFCNQDTLSWALNRLMKKKSSTFGAPRPLPPIE